MPTHGSLAKAGMIRKLHSIQWREVIDDRGSIKKDRGKKHKDPIRKNRDKYYKRVILLSRYGKQRA